nr:twin-arginine translocation signal domain-containing protein [Chloroflexota bacterium]
MTTEHTTDRKLSRRNFLRVGAGTGATVALSGLIARNASASPTERNKASRDSGGYGMLYPMQTENTGETLLALPE